MFIVEKKSKLNQKYLYIACNIYLKVGIVDDS